MDQRVAARVAELLSEASSLIQQGQQVDNPISTSSAAVPAIANAVGGLPSLYSNQSNRNGPRPMPMPTNSVSSPAFSSVTPTQSGTQAAGMLGVTVNRARQMLSNSARNGVYSRLNQRERLRAGNSNGTISAPRSSSKRPVAAHPTATKKKPDKAIEYALLKAKAVMEGECEADDTLKWNSVIADGIIMSSERDGERDIRTKIADSLRRKFPLFGGDDFDFIKVRHKRISQPELQATSEFNYMVVKKLAGQGMLYIRVKPGRGFFVDDADEEQDDDDLLKPYYDESKDKEQTAKKDESESTVQVIDLVEESVGKEKENVEEAQVKALGRPLPNYNIQPLIEEATKEALINPVEVIRFFQKKLHRGRDLHILDASVISAGETNYISVDRSRLLETTIAELKYVKDFRLTFEVDFMGELAQDMGGPRLEWIELVNKEMQAKYFEHGLREHLSDEYYYVGIMCCIALLQNGQIPRIFPSEVLDQLFDATAVTTSPCIQQLQKGLQELGLLDVFCSFPIMRHIFQPVSQPLAAKRVIQLLQPQFSCEGSNAFMREKEVYALFIKYIREVASGRRGNVSLGNILSFTTGCSEEPILGFSFQPTMRFIASEEYIIEEKELSSAATAEVCLSNF